MSILRRSALAVVLALAVLVPSAATAAPASPTAASATVRHWARFTMPSRNIACLFDSGTLRCDIFSGLKPEPRKQCRFFWSGVMLSTTGRPSYLCIIDTIYDPKAPTLHYGTAWTRLGIVCHARRTGLRCHNESRHGFFLSRERSTTW